MHTWFEIKVSYYCKFYDFDVGSSGNCRNLYILTVMMFVEFIYMLTIVRLVELRYIGRLDNYRTHIN